MDQHKDLTQVANSNDNVPSASSRKRDVLYVAGVTLALLLVRTIIPYAFWIVVAGAVVAFLAWIGVMRRLAADVAILWTGVMDRVRTGGPIKLAGFEFPTAGTSTDIAQALERIDGSKLFRIGADAPILCKVSTQTMMRSTKGVFVGTGTLVQVSTRKLSPDGRWLLAESLAFAPGVRPRPDLVRPPYAEPGHVLVSTAEPEPGTDDGEPARPPSSSEVSPVDIGLDPGMPALALPGLAIDTSSWRDTVQGCGSAVWGDPDQFRLIGKAIHPRFMASTRALALPGGCLVHVSHERCGGVARWSLAEALTWVPGMRIELNPESEHRAWRVATSERAP